MGRTRLLRRLGAFGVVGGGVLVWAAFHWQLCTKGGGVENQCGPNIVFLIPGILFTLVGLGVLLMAYQRRRSGRSANTDR